MSGPEGSKPAELWVKIRVRSSSSSSLRKEDLGAELAPEAAVCVAAGELRGAVDECSAGGGVVVASDAGDGGSALGPAREALSFAALSRALGARGLIAGGNG